MTALQRKLLRDLRSIRGQVLTIALVIAAGVASYAALVGTWRSLADSLDRYYEDSRFADVFAHLKRAPDDVVAQLERIPGVAQVEAREVEEIRLDLPGMSEPAFGLLISHPRGGPFLNALHLRKGRSPEPAAAREVLVNEGFARAHGLQPGSAIAAVLNGRRATLQVVGVAISPEYVMAIPSVHGGVADDRTFGVFWMDRTAVAAAFRMEGSFNDVALRLSPGAVADEVVQKLDRVLSPYGGRGAQARDRQPSNRALQGELRQLKVEATFTPVVFLLVAAFLVNVVLSRLIATQREQIAALKALGYTDAEVALHYFELVLVVVALGAALGVALGAYLGGALMDLYARYFRFPTLEYRLDAVSAATSVLVASAAALGALVSVRQVARLPPAEGMRPPAPPVYRPLVVDRLGLPGLISQGARMVVRDLERTPLRLGMSALGVGGAIGIMIVAWFFGDAVDHFFAKQFNLVQREQITVELSSPAPASAIHELEAIPGVLRAEANRYVPVRLRRGHLHYDTAIQGLERGADLRRAIDTAGRTVPLPESELLAGRDLMRKLDLRLGDPVQIEVLDGTARVRTARVAGTFDQVVTMMPVMERSALDRLLGDAPTASGAALAVDPDRIDEVAAKLKDFPRVASATSLQRMVRLFEKQNTEILRVFTGILVAFAVAITVGVVYNNARVALAVRGRDLATLRVLGYTRRETFAILAGELAAGVLLAIPAGLVLGELLVFGFASSMSTEDFRMEAIASARTRASAIAIALLTAAVSAFLVRRRLDAVDLVSVLKARE